MSPPETPPEAVDDPPTQPTDGQAAPIQLIAGRYAVIEGIATGGMGRVVLAKHVDLGRDVALKVMQPPDNVDKAVDFEQRFRSEARILAMLDHPNLVTIHDFGVLDDGRCFLAMEYVDGPRLTDLVKEGPMEPERAIRIAAQIARALRYVHSHDIVHRDLSPSNVLIAKGQEGEEFVKLVDFGIAQEGDDTPAADDGLVLGSPHVMSPEQIDGVGVDARTDIYGFGSLLFRMLTGVWPFAARNTMTVLMGHLDKPVPRFDDVRPGLRVPDGVEAIVRRCLAKSKDDRYPDVDALLAALQSVMELPDTAWNTQSFRHDDLVTLARTAKELAHQREQEQARPRTSEPVVRMPASTFLVVALLVAGLGAAAVFLFQQVTAPVAPPQVAVPAEVITPPVQPAPETTEPAAAEPEAAEPEAAEPAPAPKPVARPKPAAKTKPAPKPAPTTKTDARAPSGYQGVPDDF